MRPRPPHKLNHLLLILGLAAAWPVWAGYTDTIVLKNGDQITGNVKALAQGQLSLDTDAMGTVLIQWDKIAEVRSDKQMQVETTSTTRYFGELATPAADGQVAVKTASSIETISIDDVVHITPIEDSFWKRIQGSLGAGFSYTKSSAVAQYSVNADVVYRTRQHQVAFAYDSIVTQQDSGTTGQVDSGLDYKGFRKNGWFGLGFIAFQRNQELGIDGRGLIGAGLGRNLIESSHSIFSLSTGLDLNVEDTTGGSDRSGEVFGKLEYLLYKYRGNQTNLALDATIYPSITESGRFRSQLAIAWRQELFNNFYWGLKLYGVSDNEPPAGALADNDYGLITSLGWNFGP